jgi:putative transposase
MRFRFIEDRRADYPVTILCDVLGVSPAGYYAWRSRPESERSAANRDLVEDIRRVHRDTSGRYGSPRIHAELKAQGRGASRGRIERLMRHNGIRAIMARPRRVRTTDSRHDLPIAPNLLGRNFFAAAPNRIWLADITYVETDQGWLYLATVLDLYSRRIVGWAMEDHLRADLPLAALKMAISAQRPGAGLIHHSDRGVQLCLGGLPQDDAVRRLPGLDEPQGRLLRQCPDGELLPHPQNRARSSPAICNTSRKGPASRRRPRSSRSQRRHRP